MYVIKMMTNREDGYRVVAQRESLAEAQAMAKAMKMYHEPIDVYVARANTTLIHNNVMIHM